jgi:hypothetical protein
MALEPNPARAAQEHNYMQPVRNSVWPTPDVTGRSSSNNSLKPNAPVRHCKLEPLAVAFGLALFR